VDFLLWTCPLAQPPSLSATKRQPCSERRGCEGLPPVNCSDLDVLPAHIVRVAPVLATLSTTKPPAPKSPPSSEGPHPWAGLEPGIGTAHDASWARWCRILCSQQAQKQRSSTGGAVSMASDRPFGGQKPYLSASEIPYPFVGALGWPVLVIL
jgi:hypothetical protein